MANIPKAREILTEALEFNMDDRVRQRIEAAMQEMYREFTGRTSVKSVPMTPEMARLIKRYATRYPDDSHQQIATVFNVNPGRVSEALAGKYD